jgi:hypothetical protein
VASFRPGISKQSMGLETVKEYGCRTGPPEPESIPGTENGIE